MNELTEQDELKETSVLSKSAVERSVMLPAALTDENGTKALLFGEFKEKVILRCNWCDGEGVFGESDCDECGGSGDYSLSVQIQWSILDNS